MHDTYSWWRAALVTVANGQTPEGWDEDGAPYDGFYRVRIARGARWLPLAIYHAGGQQLALIEGRPVSPLDYWASAFANPVTEEQYRHAMVYGTWWDSLKQGRHAPKPGAVTHDVAQAEPIGPPTKAEGNKHDD